LYFFFFFFLFIKRVQLMSACGQRC